MRLLNAYLSWPVLKTAAARLSVGERTSCGEEAFDLVAYKDHQQSHLTPVLTAFGSSLSDSLALKAVELVPAMWIHSDHEIHPLDPYLAIGSGRTGKTAEAVYGRALEFADKAFGTLLMSGGDFERLLAALPRSLVQRAVDLAKRHGPTACVFAFVEMTRRGPESVLAEVLSTSIETLHLPKNEWELSVVILAIVSSDNVPEAVLLRCLSISANIEDATLKGKLLKQIIPLTLSALNAHGGINNDHTLTCLATIRSAARRGRPHLLSTVREILPWLLEVGAGDTPDVVLATLLATSRKWS